MIIRRDRETSEQAHARYGHQEELRAARRTEVERALAALIDEGDGIEAFVCIAIRKEGNGGLEVDERPRIAGFGPEGLAHEILTPCLEGVGHALRNILRGIKSERLTALGVYSENPAGD